MHGVKGEAGFPLLRRSRSHTLFFLTCCFTPKITTRVSENGVANPRNLSNPGSTSRSLHTDTPVEVVAIGIYARQQRQRALAKPDRRILVLLKPPPHGLRR